MIVNGWCNHHRINPITGLSRYDENPDRIQLTLVHLALELLYAEYAGEVPMYLYLIESFSDIPPPNPLSKLRLTLIVVASGVYGALCPRTHGVLVVFCLGNSAINFGCLARELKFLKAASSLSAISSVIQ